MLRYDVKSTIDYSIVAWVLMNRCLQRHLPHLPGHPRGATHVQACAAAQSAGRAGQHCRAWGCLDFH